jgi:hypothetical protein
MDKQNKTRSQQQTDLLQEMVGSKDVAHSLSTQSVFVHLLTAQQVGLENKK